MLYVLFAATHGVLAGPRPPVLPSAHNASISFAGQLVWTGTESSDYKLGQKRMDIDIMEPFPLGQTTYFYNFAAMKMYSYVPKDPQSGLPGCASTPIPQGVYGEKGFAKWNMFDRPDGFSVWNGSYAGIVQGMEEWKFRTVFSSRDTESGVALYDRGANAPSHLSFHIMGDSRPGVENVTWTNWVGLPGLPASTFALPEVCKKGSSDGQESAAARTALRLAAEAMRGSSAPAVPEFPLQFSAVRTIVEPTGRQPGWEKHDFAKKVHSSARTPPSINRTDETLWANGTIYTVWRDPIKGKGDVVPKEQQCVPFAGPPPVSQQYLSSPKYVGRAEVTMGDPPKAIDSDKWSGFKGQSAVNVYVNSADATQLYKVEFTDGQLSIEYPPEFWKAGDAGIAVPADCPKA
jgi:hypothetical protein